jgi:hypothetical protein
MSEDRPASCSAPAGSVTPSPRIWPGRVSPSERVLRHRPDVLADAGQGAGPGVRERWHNLPQEAAQAFAQAVVYVGGFQSRKTEKPSHD